MRKRMKALLFSSILFLFTFLPVVLAIYFVLPKAYRNGFLLLSSLVFYAWGEPVYVFLMLFTIGFSWASGMLLARCGAGASAKAGANAKMVLAVDVIVHIGVLAFFKYGNFFLENFSRLAGTGLSAMRLPLPLGISFYTFQTMSYTIDVYRGATPAQRNIIDYGAYVVMFPQLVAGPIVRYNTIAAQLEKRQESWVLFGEGAGLFAIGLAKKVLLANNIGIVWDSIKAMDPAEMTALAAWAGIVAFGLQLYFDFSGYSDMALGMGKMLGFQFEINFDHPYISRSITEFWRRWHISLSTWFREYVYIPLGGSRRGDGRTILNLLLVWAATGFWHGANWNFILWGLYYFLFLVGEKYLWQGLLDKTPGWLRHIYVLGIVMAGWALFVFEDMAALGAFLRALGGGAGGGLANGRIFYLLRSRAFLLLLAVWGATPWPRSIWARFESLWPRCMAWLKPTLMAAGLLLSVAYLVDSSYNPFLYFRF